jgi:PPP family 3-phenylpropionic acid transporter
MGATFAAFGVWMPYWPAWLASRGLDPAQIGIAMAAWSWARALSAPALAHYVDASARPRIWLIAAAFASVLVFAAFHWATVFVAFVVLNVAYGAAQAGTIPLGEGLTILLAGEHGFSYGRVRAWGSAAFLALSVIAGRLIESNSAGIVQPLTLVFLVLAAGLAFAVPEPKLPARALARRAPLRALLGTPGLLAASLGCGIVQAAHATYSAFSTLHWQQAGHSMTAIGVFWAEGVLAEIGLFLIGRRLSTRVNERTLLAVAVGGSSLRWLALAASTSTLVIVGTQWMHALSFAAAHLALMNFFSRRVAPSLAATAQALYSACTQGANALAVAAAGFIYELSPSGAFAAMSAVALIGGLIALRGLARAERVASTAPA